MNHSNTLVAREVLHVECQNTCDAMYLHYCDQTVFRLRTRGDRPELDKILRRYVESFVARTQYRQCSLDSTTMRVMRLQRSQ